MVIPLVVFSFGAILGSFINVVILRSRVLSPGAGSALSGRSRCPHCQRPLAWFELIPILSFIIQRARCRTCGRALSLQYPLVEFFLGISALILFTPLPLSTADWLAQFMTLLVVALLVILFVIDLKTFLLPDTFIILLTAAVFLLLFLQTANYKPLTMAALGAAIGAGFLGLIWLITAGRGLGLGDVKLMLPLGALFGPAGSASLLLLAFIAGGSIATVLLLQGRVTAKSAVPFGPFLAGAGIVFLLAPHLLNILINNLFFYW